MVQAGFGILFIMCLMSAMTFLGFGLPTQQLAYGIVISVYNDAPRLHREKAF